MSDPAILETDHGVRLAYAKTEGAGPGAVFLGGFQSDMTGTKAAALDADARERGRAFLRFDYSGHGASSGTFEDGTIGLWRADALAALDRLTAGPQILVGSSMGGWIALLAALARPERVAGLVLLAPAPDFTERLIRPSLNTEEREKLERDGRIAQPNPYDDEPTVITRSLLEEGRDHLLLDRPIPIRAPVRILHGQQDDDVPWRLSLELAETLESADVETTLVKSGDHRLSTPEDLERLRATLDRLTLRLHRIR